MASRSILSHTYPPPPLPPQTINIVRRSAQIQELKSLGADEVLCSAEVDVAAKVKEITGGKGAYGAIECVGGDLFAVRCRFFSVWLFKTVW